MLVTLSVEAFNVVLYDAPISLQRTRTNKIIKGKTMLPQILNRLNSVQLVFKLNEMMLWTNQSLKKINQASKHYLKLMIVKSRTLSILKNRQCFCFQNSKTKLRKPCASFTKASFKALVLLGLTGGRQKPLFLKLSHSKVEALRHC